MEGKFNELETNCTKETSTDLYRYMTEFKNSFK
jgi:hypothetical protein